MEDSKDEVDFVTLAEASSAEARGEKRSRVVIGSHVRQQAARRSGMLAGLRNTQGPAELPSQLSSDDIRLWQAACSLDCEPSTSQLITVLQVADLLGDTRVGEWVDMLAGRVTSTSWAATLEQPEPGADMLCALLQLPGHLLRRVLTVCFDTKDLDTLLSEFPATLHPAVVSARAATGSITLPGSLEHMQMVLLQLGTIPVPPPGLLSLKLPTKFPSGCQSNKSAALLAHAMSAQPSLTSLDLSPLILPVTFYQQLSLGLKHRALPSLRSLQVAIYVHPNGIAALVSCLRHLSGLTFLRANLWFNTPPSGGIPNLEEYISLVSFPARLPDLQHLVIQERHHSHNRDLQPSSTSVSYRLFPLLICPQLTKVSFTSDTKTGSMSRVADIMRHMDALQVLSIDTDMSDDSCFLSLPEHLCDSDEGTASSCDLRMLSITSACMVTPVAAALMCACTSLTSLQMDHVHASTRTFPVNTDSTETRHTIACTPPDSDRVHKSWGRLLTILPSCCQLQDLHLSSLCSSYDGVGDAAFSRSLAVALQRLPRLTSLHLRAACTQCYPSAHCEIQGELLRTALQGMTSLQDLSICGAEDALTVRNEEGVLEVLPGLQLTSVGLCFASLQQSQVSSLLPKLTTLNKCMLMAPVLGATDEEVAAFKASFPDVAFDVWDGSV